MKRDSVENTIATTTTARRRTRLRPERRYLQEQMRLARARIARAAAGLGRTVPSLIDPRTWIPRHPVAGAAAMLGVTAAGGLVGARLRKSRRDLPNRSPSPQPQRRGAVGSESLIALIVFRSLRAIGATAWHSASRVVLGLALAEFFREARSSVARTVAGDDVLPGHKTR